MTLQGVGGRRPVKLWRAPLIALVLAVLGLLLAVLFVASGAPGITAGLVLAFPLGMAAAAIVATGQARQYGIPVPFVVALAALIAIAFAMLELALATALAGTPALGDGGALQAASNNLRTAFILIGLVLFAVSATALSALASRRGADSRQIVTTQLVLALMCLPALNVVGAAIWFGLRFTGRGDPEVADEFLPPREKPTR